MRDKSDREITLKSFQHVTVEEDPFVPTNMDLAGFWDMVYIQVEHVHSLFAELQEIRSNGWKKSGVSKIQYWTKLLMAKVT